MKIVHYGLQIEVVSKRLGYRTLYDQNHFETSIGFMKGIQDFPLINIDLKSILEGIRENFSCVNYFLRDSI
jgi:hypothetical protein